MDLDCYQFPLDGARRGVGWFLIAGRSLAISVVTAGGFGKP